MIMPKNLPEHGFHNWTPRVQGYMARKLEVMVFVIRSCPRNTIVGSSPGERIYIYILLFYFFEKIRFISQKNRIFDFCLLAKKNQ